MTVALVVLVVAVGVAVNRTIASRLALVDVRRRLAMPGATRQPAPPFVPPVLRRRRQRRADESAAVAALPDAIDLLAVAARAGLPVAAALAAVAGRAPPPWGTAFAGVVARCGRGERLGDAVDEVAAVGDVGHPLRSLLRAATDDGADLVAGLDRLAADARDLRRRRAEEAARRIPVRLLLPLVACSLPAFALLTIVPIVVGALEALDLSD